MVAIVNHTRVSLSPLFFCPDFHLTKMVVDFSTNRGAGTPDDALYDATSTWKCRGSTGELQVELQVVMSSDRVVFYWKIPSDDTKFVTY